MASRGYKEAGAKKQKECHELAIPYFVSAQYAEADTPGARILGLIGVFLHVGAWVAALIFEAIVLGDDFVSEAKFKETPVHSVLLAGIAGTIIGFIAIAVFWGVHIFALLCTKGANPLGLENGMLPPFVTSLITSGLRASLACTALALLFTGSVILEQQMRHEGDLLTAKANGLTGDDLPKLLLVYGMRTFDYLIVIFACKSFGLAMAINNQRVMIENAVHAAPGN